MEWKCKHCSEAFSDLNASNKANHTRWCDKNPDKNKFLEKLKNARDKNSSKGVWNKGLTKKNDPRLEKAGQTYKKNYKAGLFERNPLPHTEEHKKHLSQKRKEWLKNNPEKHPWKRSGKFTSEPCERLKRILREKFVFEEEFSPLDDRFFSVDIAFPTIKLCIEVNGEQHYNRDGSLRDYYQKRHDLIENAGWTILEIHYAKVYNEKDYGLVVQRIEQEFSKF